jgi:hypothetical protein
MIRSSTWHLGFVLACKPTKSLKPISGVSHIILVHLLIALHSRVVRVRCALLVLYLNQSLKSPPLVVLQNYASSEFRDWTCRASVCVYLSDYFLQRKVDLQWLAFRHLPCFLAWFPMMCLSVLSANLPFRRFQKSN